MALVVFLKGVNVGGHRTFRPSILAKDLGRFDVVNVGAAGTFVVRKSVGPAILRREMLRRLPFETEVMICTAADILRLAASEPFGNQPTRPDIVRFVSVLARRRRSASFPGAIPSSREWCVRILDCRDQFVCGLYRRNMRAIRYLGQLEKIFGVASTTRNWNTISAVVRILKNGT
jgi:uncharacterized protein (DUF1697 family)